MADNLAPADAAPIEGLPADELLVEEAPKKSGKLLMLVPVVALVVGGGFGVMQKDRIAAMLGGGDPSAAEEQVEEAEPTEYGQFSQFLGIIVNPSESGGRRYLMVDVGFESAEAKTLEELTEKEIVIRDAIVRLLSEHTVEELSEVARRPALKDTLLVTINGILEGDIDRLYFTQYVLQ